MGQLGFRYKNLLPAPVSNGEAGDHKSNTTLFNIQYIYGTALDV